MAERAVEVIVQIAGENVTAGRLWAHRRGRSESATFAYASEYLARESCYMLDPALGLREGRQQTPVGQATFGAFSDAAPDGWGRRLIQRQEARRARESSGPERSVSELDYLLGVRDDLRQGALRFRDVERHFYLAKPRAGVPHLVDLKALLAAATHLERDEESGEDLRLLLDGGSSLGGARPKAHVIEDGGRLGIAKFPAPIRDTWDVVRWEAVALTLAKEAGIDVPPFSLHEIGSKPVLVTARFDRLHGRRIGYASAMTMLEAVDGEQGSYLEIAEAIELHSPAPTRDLRELWRRIVFSRLISNTDDHLRNHGFLRLGLDGWSLCPAFDLNPNPQRRGFGTVIDHGQDGDEIETALGVAELFRLGRSQADTVITQVREAISHWRATAASLGLSASAIDRMRSAFAE